MATQTQATSGYQGTVAALNAGQNIEPALATQLGHRTLELSGKLQTTLDTQELIALFSDELSHDIQHQGMHYLNDNKEIATFIGRRSAHKCTYQLVIEGNSLGELVLFSKKPFDAEELVIIENLLCALVYPLRNALLYRSALQSALIDPLTGTRNRAGMDAALKREIELSHRHNSPMCIMLLDIDHFKSVNDKFGHAGGDFVLQAVAQCVEETIRGSDMLFRFGGEEFLIMLSCTELEGALLLAERIRQKIAALSFAPHRTLQITASLGVSALQQNETMDALFERTDKALYAAKESGRNRVIRG